MKKKTHKIPTYLPPILSNYFGWLFCDAAENHIRVTRLKKNKFASFTQLKKYQKRMKMTVGAFVLALFFLFVGLMFGSILFPPPIESELYIPNGKGDIILGNISKNQATVIFKTLDSANGNRPLATKAFVEFFSDKDYVNLVRRSVEDDYAVTHIIPIDSLQEGKVYYVRIIAIDPSAQNKAKVVSTWGGGKDPITVYTAGEVIADCSSPVGRPKTIVVQNNEEMTAPMAETFESEQEQFNVGDDTQDSSSFLRIETVMNENYLQPGKKVQTIISWETNRPASTVLIYGEGNSNEKREVVINDQFQTKHAAVLTTLKTATTYYFQAKSVDKNGNMTISQQYSFRTPKPQSTIVDQIAVTFKTIFQQIKPN